jgi:dihydroneopterin aldolase
MKTFVVLANIDCTCVVGIHALEQVQAQRLEIDVIMDVYRRGQLSNSLKTTVDFDVTVKAVQFFCQHGHWLLAEDIAEGIARWLLLPPHDSERRAPIDSITVKVRKPDVFKGLAVPSVECKADVPASASGPSRETTILETSCVSAKRLILEAGEKWTKQPRESLFVLSGVLRSSGADLPQKCIGGRSIEAVEYQVIETAALLVLER